MEVVGSVEEIQHPLVRHELTLMGFQRPKLDIASIADAPAGKNPQIR
jgi:hypothetical protein